MMSAYDITEYLRTAYQLFAYCVPSKPPWILRTKKGGVTLINPIENLWHDIKLDLKRRQHHKHWELANNVRDCWNSVTTLLKGVRRLLEVCQRGSRLFLLLRVDTQSIEKKDVSLAVYCCDFVILCFCLSLLYTLF